MDGNQSGRRNISLSKENESGRPVREAYPIYNNNINESELQRQEYRNVQQPSYQEQDRMPYGSNVPSRAPETQNYMQPSGGDNLSRYYDYGDTDQAGMSNNGGVQYQPQYQQPHYQQPQPQYQQPQYQQTAVPPQVSSGAQKFCQFCGGRIAMNSVVCIHCGRQVDELKYNNNVGGNIQNNINVMPAYTPQVNRCYPPDTSDKSKSTAIALAALGFLGLGGIHRLYSGRVVSGLVYLMTAGLFGLGTVVDIIKLASDTFKDGAGYIIRR